MEKLRFLLRMLNKFTKINWLLVAVFVILLQGCASAPQEPEPDQSSTTRQGKRPAEYSYAIELMKRGENAQAYNALTKLVTKYPHADVYTNLAIINLKQKQYEQALGNIEKSISANGNNAVSRTIYGLTLKNTGKFGQAEAEYNKAITLDPNYAAPYLNLAILYDVFLNSPKKSLPYYEKYKELSGKDIEKWLVELKRRIK